MVMQKKLLGEERRSWILQQLKDSPTPLTGSELAVLANVSRQVIVGDITILKAKSEPIIATSQGYIYLKQNVVSSIFERTVACRHLPEETESELNLLVDHGVTVKDVRIDHPVYGDLIASIMVSNRQEVKQFMEKVRATQAGYLSELTDGIHLHTLASSNKAALERAEAALHDAGYLVEQ
jgi:transcriptional regulator of NAD metabolism